MAEPQGPVQSLDNNPGLPREEYIERVNAKDDASLAALDEAFGDLAEQAARHEALRRAYEASGRTVEEFAEMYGLELKTVKRALAVPAAAPSPRP
jgi:hypothetical protein